MGENNEIIFENLKSYDNRIERNCVVNLVSGKQFKA